MFAMPGSKSKAPARNLAAGLHSTTFTFDGGGGSSGAISIAWQKVGNFVTLYLPTIAAVTGAGSTALSSNTPLPNHLRPPVNSQNCAVNNISNNAGGTSSAGLFRITTAGVLTVFRDNIATAFSNGASAGTSSEVSVTYFVG